MSPSGGEDTATLVIPTDTEPSVDVVDAWLNLTLRGLPALQRLRTVLVVRELLGHGRSAPYVVRLSVVDRGHTLAVSVDDATTAPAGPDPAGLIVAALATRWGVEQRRQARTTWAEFHLDEPRLRLFPPRQPRPGSPGRRPR